jgi:hypothetical protein
MRRGRAGGERRGRTGSGIASAASLACKGLMIAAALAVCDEDGERRTYGSCGGPGS